MGNLDVDLNYFVERYVYHALNLVGNNGGIPLDNFEEGIREKLSEELDVTSEFVKYLHHPFHWAFFVDSRYGFNSPLRYIQPRFKDEPPKIELTGEVNESEESKLVNYILSEHGTLLRSKIEVFSDNGTNIFHQQD